MTDRISPGLLAALEHFSDVRMDQKEAHYFRFQRAGCHELWTIEEACSKAKDLLGDEALNRLKLDYLKMKMRNIGLGHVFDQIMEGKI